MTNQVNSVDAMTLQFAFTTLEEWAQK